MLHETDVKRSAAMPKLPRRCAGVGDLPACFPGLRPIIQALALGSALLFSLPAQPAFAACPAPVTVTSETPLNNAILAFNAATAPCAAVIELGDNIFLSDSTTPIDNPTPGVSLTIQVTAPGAAVKASKNGDTWSVEVNDYKHYQIPQVVISGG